MGKSSRLSGHRSPHFWKLRAERVLWLLLRTNAAKILLGYGMFESNVVTSPATKHF